MNSRLATAQSGAEATTRQALTALSLSCLITPLVAGSSTLLLYLPVCTHTSKANTLGTTRDGGSACRIHAPTR